MSYITIDGVHYTKEEYEAREEEKRLESLAQYRAGLEAKAQAEREGQRLVGDLGRAYSAYEDFLKENPGLALHLKDEEAVQHKVCEDLLKKLKKADLAPRCGYIKVNGSTCASPRMKGKEMCYAHDRWAGVRPQKMDLPPMEDANSIQVGLMQVARGLLDGQLEPRIAGLMLRCLKIASSNVAYTNFEGD